MREHLEQALAKPVIPPGSVAPAADHDLYVMLADTAALQRDEAAVRKYAPLAEESSVRYGHTLYEAIAQRAWGVAHRLAGEYAEADARLKQALELFESMEARHQMGRTLFEWGELAQAQSDVEGARQFYSRALALFEGLGAAPDAERTRAALEALE